MPVTAETDSPPSIDPRRLAAVDRLTRAARHFPHLFPDPDPYASPLEMLLVRTAMQRWLSFAALTGAHLLKRFATLQPPLQAVLLAACAERFSEPPTPDYAIVDAAVDIARLRVNRRAAGMVNAVLRRTLESVGEVLDQPWLPAVDRMPWTPGRTVALASPLLPPCTDAAAGEPGDADPAALAIHLEAAASLPRRLARRWHDHFGPERTIRLAAGLHQPPPTLIAFGRGDAPAAEDPVQPHDQPGFAVWRGPASELGAYLAAHPGRRVQDPTSADAVDALPADVTPTRIVDLCAGSGTKTRQLADRFPNATVFAGELDQARLQRLREAAGSFGESRVEVYQPVTGAEDEPARPPALPPIDLAVVDAPCSNTGVLTRRLEARYRFRPKLLGQLVSLQQALIDQAATRLAPTGWLLYAVCSIEPEEGPAQAVAAAERHGLKIVAQALTLPEGSGTSYRDGGYHALMRRGEGA